MQQDRDVLANELCHVVVAKLAYMAVTGQGEVLKSVGVSESQLGLLERMSPRDLARSVQIRKYTMDVAGLMQALFPEHEYPEEWKEFLQHGANNKMMKHFFGSRAEECSAYREKLTIEPPFRARSIAHKKHSAVCKALQAEGPYQQISAEALLKIAKTYQVSLCALWKELEEWDKYDQ